MTQSSIYIQRTIFCLIRKVGTQLDVEHFLHNITDVRNIIAAENRQNAEMLADGFNFFDFIAPNEMRLSAILAWMLIRSKATGKAINS